METNKTVGTRAINKLFALDVPKKDIAIVLCFLSKNNPSNPAINIPLPSKIPWVIR